MRARQAVALFAALGLMAMIGLLVAGAVASSTIAQRSSRLAHTDALLATGGDYALGAVLADPERFGLADLAYGRASALDVPIPGAGAGERAVVTATRLRDGVVWLVAEVTTAGLDTGRRRTNLLLRFPKIGAFPPAGIVARGGVRLGPDVSFVPDSTADPDCSRPGGPDVVVAPGSVVTGGNSPGVATVPDAADSATYYLTAGQVAALAVGGQVVRVRGDTTIAGGVFSGILVADGSITIGGAFAARGLIIAAGRIRAISGPFAFSGAIMSFAPPSAGGVAIDLADAIVQHSPCVVAQMLRRAIAPRPVRMRGWAELF